MNHLRELVDVVEKSELYICEDIDEVDYKVIRSIISNNIEEAVCFFVDIDSLDGIKPVRDLYGEFPFPSNWFECNFENPLNGKQTILGLLATQYKKGQQAITVIRKYDGVWVVLALIRLVNGMFEAVGLHDREFIESIFPLVRVYLTAMRCNNVKSIEHHPPLSLQKSRAKRGKKPLFSYWTLELKQERTEGDPLGDTHASPRLHLRRGHPRQFAPGKWTWVQPCVVGNKAAGIVHKDYRLAA
jgi:hypothetical protein